MMLTDWLNAEHQVFLGQLKTLAGMLSQGQRVAEMRTAALALGEAVERHRAVEERVLFPAILQEFGAGFPPIRVMEAEHHEIAECLQQIASGGAGVAVAVRRFVEVLSEHIAKETQVLFPMAELRIGADELERLGSLTPAGTESSSGAVDAD